MSQSFDLVARGHSHGNYVLCGPNERHIQERRQPAARLDLGPGPVGVVRAGLLRVQTVVLRVDAPDRVLMVTAGEIDEEYAVESLGPCELRRQFRGIVASADEEDVALMVVQSRKQGAGYEGGASGEADWLIGPCSESAMRGMGAADTWGMSEQDPKTVRDRLVLKERRCRRGHR